MSMEIIAFDADDTLWHNEIYYRRGRQLFESIMSDYELPEAKLGRVDEIEVENINYFGYGAVGFAISLTEAAIELTEGRISAQDVQRLLSVAKDIIDAEVELFDDVETILSALSEDHRLLLITKGDLRHQRDKVERSGLRQFFEGVEIVSEKNKASYRTILDRWRVEPSQFLMVGNAMRSDILPVLSLGGLAAHLPQQLTWEHEQAEANDLPSDRFFRLEELSQVLLLVNELDSR